MRKYREWQTNSQIVPHDKKGARIDIRVRVLSSSNQGERKGRCPSIHRAVSMLIRESWLKLTLLFNRRAVLSPLSYTIQTHLCYLKLTMMGERRKQKLILSPLSILYHHLLSARAVSSLICYFRPRLHDFSFSPSTSLLINNNCSAATRICVLFLHSPNLPACLTVCLFVWIRLSLLCWLLVLFIKITLSLTCSLTCSLLERNTNSFPSQERND